MAPVVFFISSVRTISGLSGFVPSYLLGLYLLFFLTAIVYPRTITLMGLLCASKSIAAALLFSPLTASICRAQACYSPQGPNGPIVDLTPEYYAPGQSYNAVLTNPPPEGWFVPASPPVPPIVVPGVFVLTAASIAAQNWTTEDPFVTVTNFAYVSPACPGKIRVRRRRSSLVRTTSFKLAQMLRAAPDHHTSTHLTG